MSFGQGQNNFLRTLPRGTRVYVEANLEVREPQQDAEPGSPTSMRQVFLRHGTLTTFWELIVCLISYRTSSCIGQEANSTTIVARDSDRINRPEKPLNYWLVALVPLQTILRYLFLLNLGSICNASLLPPPPRAAVGQSGFRVRSLLHMIGPVIHFGADDLGLFENMHGE